ncbi:PREDICTED: putative F-box protein At5g50220 [Camelina sativa]|uniref:F-box protein At5g50220 n=1 Tax=Camelina sativa TaxID=90675 RepID=A0ABM0YXK2_CAMSA|nr:PREDICTED: putative F-box protein At5g50220 [Camelina sativa]
MASCFFGYEPFENQYKALFIPLNHMEEACKFFTLGDPTAKEWRTIQGVGYHFPRASVVSINGSIHYLAWDHDDNSASKFKLMSFDLRREKFYHVEAPKTLRDHVSTLINYQGKLGFVCCEKHMEIWVMEDVEKKTKGWSRIFFYEMEGFQKWHISSATRAGEIAFVDDSYLYDDLSCLLYYVISENQSRMLFTMAKYI